MSVEAAFIREDSQVRFAGLMCDNKAEIELNTAVKQKDCLEGSVEKSMGAAKAVFEKAGYLILEADVGFVAICEFPKDLTKAQAAAKGLEYFNLIDEAFPGLGSRMFSQVVSVIPAE
jgi:hypothetical protein